MILLALLPASAIAQSASSTRWTFVAADPAIAMDTVEIRSGADLFRAYVARPAKAGVYPAVIVLHANRITEPYIATTTQMLARAGFAAMAVDLFHFTPGNETWEASRSVRGDTMNAVIAREFREPRMIANLQGAISWLHAQSFAAKGGIALLGFCGGGWNALISSAQLEDVGAVVAFYAPTSLSDVQHRSVMELAPYIRVPVQYHRASNDEFVPAADVDRFVRTMTAQGTPVERFDYDASHGFLAWNRAGIFKEPEANLAWSRTISFLRATAGKPLVERTLAPARMPGSAPASGGSHVMLHGAM